MLKKCEDLNLCGKGITDIIISNNLRDLLVFCGFRKLWWHCFNRYNKTKKKHIDIIKEESTRVFMHHGSI